MKYCAQRRVFRTLEKPEAYKVAVEKGDVEVIIPENEWVFYGHQCRAEQNKKAYGQPKEGDKIFTLPSN